MNKQHFLSGEYEFDNTLKQLTYNTEDETGKKTSGESMMIRTNVGDVNFMDAFEEYRDKKFFLREIGIGQIVGAINTEMIKPEETDKQRIFVLPSQLNAAEYPNERFIVKLVNDYKNDNTGGPRGQLAGDPAVAQFILDNAANDGNRDGINNVAAMSLKNMQNKNGYLIPNADFSVDDAESFRNGLKKMQVMGFADVNVTGIVSGDYNEFAKFEEKPLKVDLIYASAMPLTSTYGVQKNELTKSVARMVLFGQYIASMKWAAERRQKSHLILMPLGGGVFKNDKKDIKICIAAAYSIMKPVLDAADVNVSVLAWEQSAEEQTIFR